MKVPMQSREGSGFYSIDTSEAHEQTYYYQLAEAVKKFAPFLFLGRQIVVHWGLAGGTVMDLLDDKKYRHFAVEPVPRRGDVEYLTSAEALKVLDGIHVFDAYTGSKEAAIQERIGIQHLTAQGLCRGLVYHHYETRRNRVLIQRPGEQKPSEVWRSW